MKSRTQFSFQRPISLLSLLYMMFFVIQTIYSAGTEASDVKQINLSSTQLQTVQKGVQQMAETQQVDLSQVTATTHSSGPGIHVCGYAAYKDKTGADQALPFYVELREKAGQPVAERGQIASDDSKLSKVNFVCRKNKGE